MISRVSVSYQNNLGVKTQSHNSPLSIEHKCTRLSYNSPLALEHECTRLSMTFQYFILAILFHCLLPGYQCDV